MQATADPYELDGTGLMASTNYDDYWRMAHNRMEIFWQRVEGQPPPYSTDPVLAQVRITNDYRVLDRISQYLLGVQAEGSQEPVEVLFRTLLFKVFNTIETWEAICDEVGDIPTTETYDVESLALTLDLLPQVFNPAYLTTGGHQSVYGRVSKVEAQLMLVQDLATDYMVARLSEAFTPKHAYLVLDDRPLIGRFLAMQLYTDINYSDAVLDFPESAFVMAGPGARRGVNLCFVNNPYDYEYTIMLLTERQDEAFDRLELPFRYLPGRKLQPIDIQNLFCEFSKWHKTMKWFRGDRERPKLRRWLDKPKPLPDFITFPPKWGLEPIPTRRLI